jgi:hypothetical protein
MADDIKAENYRKSVEKILNNWATKVAPLFKELNEVLAELEPLQANKNPSPDEKKKIEDLQKKCAELRKKIDTASTELRLNLMIIEVPPKADEKELVKLPGWFKEIVKKKGIPLGKHVTLVPDLSVDVKKKKLKSAGITLKVEF